MEAEERLYGVFMFGSDRYCPLVTLPAHSQASNGCKHVRRPRVSSCCAESNQVACTRCTELVLCRCAAEVAKSAAERAAKRPKLTPFKDENVKPIPTRARSERTLQEMSTMQTSQDPTQVVTDSTAAVCCCTLLHLGMLCALLIRF